MSLSTLDKERPTMALTAEETVKAMPDRKEELKALIQKNNDAIARLVEDTTMDIWMKRRTVCNLISEKEDLITEITKLDPDWQKSWHA